MEEVKVDPVLKDYIDSSRKAGFLDIKIRETLKNAGWPDNHIDAAMKQDKPAPVQPSPVSAEKKQPEKTAAATSASPAKDELFTKPEALQPAQQEVKKEEPKKENKKFSLLAFISIFVCWIPFIGLGVAMAALESAKKNKQSGSILAWFALLINLAIIGFIAYALYQIFTLTPDQMTGFSKYVVNTFNLG